MRNAGRWGMLVLVLGLLACKGEARVAWRPPPPPDTDGDGIVDPYDRCPGALEDRMPPVVDDGCPHPDPDGDGVLAHADRCPIHPETVNGFEDADGCPDTPPPAPVAPRPIFKGVRLTHKAVEIDEKIAFETNSAEISSASDELIKNIAGLIKAHPDLDFIEVAGHADTRGSNKLNKTLTQERAESVMKQLIAEGVDDKRLRAVGYGPFCTLDAAFTDEAHAKNRRVEFVILRRGGRELKAKWGGCPAAETKGMIAVAIPATAPKSAPKAVPRVKVAKIPGQIVRTGSVLTLPENPTFETDKATLTSDAERVLTLLKDYLIAHPEITKIRIEGHAAKLQNNPTLEKLSAERAQTVVKWLVDHGVEASRLYAVGCGAKRLVLGDGGQPDLDESKRTEAHVVETNGQQEADQPILPADCEEVE